MSKLFYTTFFSFFMLIILGVNMAYCFDLVNVMNPISEGVDFKQYFFGFGSIVENFKNYFQDSYIITGLNAVNRNWGDAISSIFNFFESISLTAFATMGASSSAWRILAMLFAIITMITQFVPVIVLLAYGLWVVIYVLIYVLYIVLFLLLFFTGAFKTPLPNTYDFDPPTLELAISRVIPSCMLHLAL